MMNLISTWYLNLTRRPDKATYTKAMLTGVDCLLEQIHRIDAHDGADYENTALLCDAAIAEGFPWFEKLRDCWMGKGNVATMWSWCKSLRLLSQCLQEEECAIFMLDDQTLRQPFWKFGEAVSDLDDLKILQVSQWLPHEKDEAWSPLEKFPPCNDEPVNDFCYKGFNGAGDAVTIFSAEGAALMLDWFAEDPYQFPEIQIYLRSKTVFDGCYSFQEPHLWSGFVDDRIFAKKGTDRENL